MDAGTSGGVWGPKMGYCPMMGGDLADFARSSRSSRPWRHPTVTFIAERPDGPLREDGPQRDRYGVMQAYAEGFEIMQASAHFPGRPDKTAELWNRGSVVRSWLLELTALALEQDPGLEHLKPWADDSGEGSWTVEESLTPRYRAGDHPESNDAFPLAPGQLLWRADAGRDAPSVQRTRGEDEMSRLISSAIRWLPRRFCVVMRTNLCGRRAS